MAEESIVAHYIEDECVFCGLCVEVCGSEAISEGDGIFVIDPDRCTDSMECVKVCPIECIVATSVESRTV